MKIGHVKKPPALPPNGRYIYVGRGAYDFEASPLANPFRLAEHFDAVVKYRDHLETKLDEADPYITEAFYALTDNDVLLCWCKNGDVCHARVIRDVWEKRRDLKLWG